MNALDFFPALGENQKLLISIDAVHPRSYPEFVNFGAEYSFMNKLFLRGGYVTNKDEYDFTFGFGIRSFGFAIDYSYTPFTVFNSINRFTIRFAL